MLASLAVRTDGLRQRCDVTDPRTWSAAVLVFVALVLQVTLVPRLPLPGGASPDLVLVVVAALALRTGALRGCVTGFGAGLVADVVPPAAHTIGRYALVYCVVGYLVGLASGEIEDSPVLSSLAVALGALGGTLAYTALGAALGDPRVTGAVLVRVMPVSILYDVVLSPLAWYAVAKLVRRDDRGRGRRGFPDDFPR